MIYLCIPSGGSVLSPLLTIHPNAGDPGTFAIDPDRTSSAALDNANSAWCAAWNDRFPGGYTHFAIAHSDVVPDHGWLKVMVDEMERVGADILAAVIPIKDHNGLTSTGILIRDEYKREVHRLTMTEIFDLPETFSIEHTGHPGQILAVNTGLSLYKMDSWFGDFPGFNLTSIIVHQTDGQLVSRFWSEDWEMSRWADEKGLRVFATRKVGLDHVGQFSFSNRHVWGKWKRDEAYPEDYVWESPTEPTWERGSK